MITFLRRAVERRGGVTDRLIRALMNVYGLSVLEARVVRLTIAGESRSDIARMLFVSPNTVDRHAARIHQRIGRSLKSLRGREADELLAELEAKLKKAAPRARQRS